MSSQVFDDFAAEQNTRAIAVWCGDDELQVESGGIPALIPPVDVVADNKSRGTRYRFGAPIDPQTGKPIPGAILLESRTENDPSTGGVKVMFDAHEWVKLLKANNKALLDRGFSVVSAPEHVKAAQAAGRPKWIAKKKLEWQATLAEEMRRRKKLEERGEPYTESSSADAVREAVAGLTKVGNAELQASVPSTDITRLLGVVTPSRPIAVEVAPPVVVSEPTEEDTVNQIADAIFKTAEKHSVNLTKAELVGLIKRDHAVMEAVEDKLKEAGHEVEYA